MQFASFSRSKKFRAIIATIFLPYSCYGFVLSRTPLYRPCRSLGIVSKSFSSRLSTKSNMSSASVVVVGSVNMDLTVYTSKLPQKGETVLGQQFATACGGKGANQAVAAASIGVPGVEVSMICKVGRDSYGSLLLDNFEKHGVQMSINHSTLYADECSTGVATIIVEKEEGENVIVVVPGANGQLDPTDVELALRNVPHPPTVVVSQLEINANTVLRSFSVAKQLKSDCITILNPSPVPSNLSEEFYNLSDFLIVNESEARILGSGGETEDYVAMAKVMLDKGIKKAVIVTLGAKGCVVTEKTGNVITVPVPSLPCDELPVKDTVGAGDAFCGAFASYMCYGLSLMDATRRACGFASVSVRKLGAQSSYPTRDELPEELTVSSDDVIGSATKRQRSFVPPPITFVTGNKKKLEEVRRLLETSGNIPFIITNKKLDLPELQGEVEEIAIEKCKLAAKEVEGPVMTEDTSLCFSALNGLPGPYIKWFLEKCGHSGLNGLISGSDDKTAYAQTIVAFCAGPGCEVKLFDGRTHGKIVQARGPLDFGWDPVFEPNEGGGLTYAEMEKDMKNSISHRGRSFAKFKEFLLEEEFSILKDIGG